LLIYRVLKTKQEFAPLQHHVVLRIKFSGSTQAK